jgi:uncharacterized protein
MPAKSPGSASFRTAAAKPCPICGKPSVAASRPFCSDRCRDVDLNRWLSGSYAIPVRPDEDEEGD